MKFLATIFCIYILSVSVAPCCADNETNGYDCSTEQSAGDTDAHSDCSGLCSPFCLCDACGGFTVEFPADDYPPEQEYSNHYRNFFSPIYSFLLPEGIWQPPRF